MKKNKKGFLARGMLWGLVAFVIVMGVYGITNSLVADVVQDIRDDYSSTDAAYEIADHGLNASKDLGAKQGTFVSAGTGVWIIAFIIFSVGGIVASNRLG